MDIKGIKVDGTTNAIDYNALSNRPSINGVTLNGNTTLDQFGVATESLAIKAYPLDIEAGDPAVITDGADGLPIKSLIVNIVPNQSGSGTPSLNNIRPISGWRSVTVSHSGDTTETVTVTIPTDPGIVYGGTLDVISGLLTVTHRFVTYDGSESWGTIGVGYRCSLGTLPGLGTAYSDKDVSSWLQTAPYGHNPTSSSTAIENTFLCGGFLNVNVSGVESVDDLKTLLSSQPLQVAYVLKTPMTYQCDPAEITTALGDNTISANTGGVTVEYRADPTLLLQKLTGSTEDDMVSDINIDANTYFMVGNALYLSTAAISSGSSIIPNTNCTLTNLAEALNAIKS